MLRGVYPSVNRAFFENVIVCSAASCLTHVDQMTGRHTHARLGVRESSRARLVSSSLARSPARLILSLKRTSQAHKCLPHAAFCGCNCSRLQVRRQWQPRRIQNARVGISTIHKDTRLCLSAPQISARPQRWLCSRPVASLWLWSTTICGLIFQNALPADNYH